MMKTIVKLVEAASSGGVCGGHGAGARYLRVNYFPKVGVKVWHSGVKASAWPLSRAAATSGKVPVTSIKSWPRLSVCGG